jgi:hypothetical protein
MALQRELKDCRCSSENNIQSARLGGFGNSDLAVELFVQVSCKKTCYWRIQNEYKYILFKYLYKMDIAAKKIELMDWLLY